MPKKPLKKSAKKQLTKPSLKARLTRPVQRIRALRARRPHKSFVLTSRRDIPRRVALPGYVSFTRTVIRMLMKYRRTFGKLLLLYVVIAFLLIGLSQQDQLRTLTGAINEVKVEQGGDVLDATTQVVGLFGATILGTLNNSLSDIQQFYLAILYIFMWLVVVWLLRQLIAGNKVTVRDGLYNAGTPFVASLCIAVLMVLQALPGAIGFLVFSVSIQSDLVLDGVAAMMIGVAALLLATLSLYWLASSIFALLIVTLPGTYPMAAIRAAGDLAVGRRLNLLLRFVWLLVLLLVLWAVIVIPALVIDTWLNQEWLPLVTLAVELATGLSFIVGVSYVFLLYRRMIDEKA